MAVFGLGAFYDGTDDMTDSFVSSSAACIGWPEIDARPLHKALRHIKIGDIIYIKAHPPSVGLIIKAVGIVMDDEIFSDPDLGEACLRVRWLWRGNDHVGQVGDRYNVRNNTLYEEFNPEISRRVIALLIPEQGQ